MAWILFSSSRRTAVRGFATRTTFARFQSHRQQQPGQHHQRVCHRLFASVTGDVYTVEDDDDDAPKVTLFTKEGCTLCDKVKDILKDLREEIPHNLNQIDITDEIHQEWFGKYKYDIPVLHINGEYWLKHRTTEEEAKEGLLEAKEGNFQPRTGEPNAEAMER